jgi:septum formation protein
VKLLLASKSAARRQMLAAAGVPFEAAAGPLDEEAVKARLRMAGLGAAALAEGLAEAKALSIDAAPGVLVLGSDQTLEHDDGRMQDKPAYREEAHEQLARMSGRSHQLHSAAAIAEEGRIVWRSLETTRLQVRPIGDDFIRSYLDAEYESIRYGIGGYRIEGPGVQLFERIEGSHFAVLGMPLLPLLAFLRERGIVPA